MSEQAKHTPGPWNAGRPDMGTVVDGVTSKWIYAGEQYVAVASGHIEGSWDEVMANAALIAAAPDLLAACEAYDAMWAKACPDGPDLSKSRLSTQTIALWSQVRAAIAKAKGEQP